MMKYAVIGSGSSANSYIFEGDDFAVIVDNGFSLKEFQNRAENMGFKTEKIKLIFLTHRHIDHSRGICSLSRKLKVPVVMGSDVVLDSPPSNRVYKRINVEPGMDYSCEGIDFSVFMLSHDSKGSVSYSFNFEKKKYTIITDTGIILPDMENHAKKSDVLFLEANYCPDMLRSGPYPEYLKNRILSEEGHLSNENAVEFLLKINNEGNNGDRITYLCHLSDTNNCSEKLESYIRSSMPESFRYRICRKGEPVAGLF